MRDVVTGEAVVLDLPVARLPTRAIGFTIDVVVVGLIALGVGTLVSIALEGADPALSTALLLAGVVTVLVVVPTTIETLTHGRSLGKIVLGLRVVRDDGGPTRLRHGLVRALAGVFADFVLTGGAGAVICSLAHPQGKRIGDVLAGTLVVREAKGGVLDGAYEPVPPMPPLLAGWAATLQLAALPPDLALNVRAYLLRRSQLDPATDRSLAQRLAEQVAAYVAPPPPPGIDPVTYLVAVLAERRRRAGAPVQYR